MTTKKTGIKALALLAGSSLALTACATSNSGSNSSSSAGGSSSASASASGAASGGTVTWGYAQEFAQYNANTEDGNSSANQVVLNGVLPGFWVFKPDGSLLANTDFGTYAKTSDNPLTVKYTFNEKAVWSDGKPIDCDDAVLAWLAKSGTTGDKGFSAASNAGYESMNPPACKDGDKEFTITYKTPFADWAAMFGAAEILPAHIVEAQAGMTKKFIDYAATPTSPDLAKAIAFYNTGWALNPGEVKKDIMPASGPFMIDAWSSGQSLTLKKNDKWWGTPAKSDTVVIRYIGDTAQAQALQNGEIDAMDPQPQVDIVNQLKGMGDKINFGTGDAYSFEHLDFNFAGVFKDKNLREAFTKCIPRQQIVDNLIKPQNEGAQIMQSRYVFPFQSTYSQFATSVGGEKYNTVDIAGAKSLLAGKKVDVRIGWRKDEQVNKRRADTLALLKASCDQAGFNIIDAGTPTFFKTELPSGNFDVAMFAWSGSPLVSGSFGTYDTDGGQNFGKYSNPKVDALVKSLGAELDPTKQTEILKQLDTLLWTDLASIPLFTFPAVFASSKKVSGVEYNATQADLSWNIQDWSAS